MQNNYKMLQITPCIWQEKDGDLTADYYLSIFENSTKNESNQFITSIQFEGQNLNILTDGPAFQLNPSISLTINSSNTQELQNLWEKLSANGSILMPLQEYTWSKLYGWCKDKYGLTWQFIFAELEAGMKKIQPSLLFVGEKFGKCNEAVDFYTKLFNGAILGKLFYGNEMPEYKGAMMHSMFTIGNQSLVAMDGPGVQDYDFNEAFSFIIHCNNQDEVDYYWNNLIADGGAESRCGWCKDKFGISWQVIPIQLIAQISNPNEEERNYAIQSMMKMNKIVIADLFQ